MVTVPQLSVAVTAFLQLLINVVLLSELQETVRSGILANTGASPSVIVMVLVAVAVLPQASVAVKVTVYVPQPLDDNVTVL